MSHLEVKQGKTMWNVETAAGSGVTSSQKKSTAKATARDMAQTDGYSHVLIHDTNGRVNDVWWNPEFHELTVEYNPSQERWELWEPGQRHFGHNKKSEVVRIGKDKQENHGYQRLKIETKDGGVSWTRKHPHKRRR